jgi:uncharacterized protein (DUF433 family)
VTEDDRFTRPLYTLSQAARLVGMPASTLTTWARGYRRRFEDRADVVQGPVVTAVQPDTPGGLSIPFGGLVEATVVQAFRRTELPLQRIRRALAVLEQEGRLSHALASKRLYTDGARVLFDYATESDDGQLRLLTVVENGQRVFHEVIQDYLSRISFDDQWATELIVPVTEHPILRIRPEVASGDAVFVHGGAPWSAVLSRYQAGESIEALVTDYDVPAADLREAIRDLKVAPLAA